MKTQHYLCFIVASQAFFTALPPLSAQVDPQDLQQRVEALENRLSKLEQQLQPVIQQARQEAVVENQQLAARERMRQDREKYSQEQLREIEELYQSANKNLGSPAAKAALEKLVSEYDDANRTGCAVLYLGQMTSGDEQIAHLKTAIDNFSDCYYGNGVQVGPYARFYLARRYQQDGKTEQAQLLVNEILEKYPNAINHKGRLLKNLVSVE